jgi:hypothetical protein
MLLFLTANGRVDDIAALEASIFGDGKGKHVQELDENLLKWSVLLKGGGPAGWGDEFKPKKLKTNGSS